MSRIVRVVVAVAGAVAAIAASIIVPLVVRRSRPDSLDSDVRLALDRAYDAAGTLTIRTERGVVTLRGEVDDIDDIARLERVVRSVPGVVDVDNLLRLQLTGVAARPTVLTA